MTKFLEKRSQVMVVGRQEQFDIGQYQRSGMNNHRRWSNNRVIDWAKAPHCLR